MERYQYQEIAELESPLMYILANGLAAEIDSLKYAVVVGDARGGSVPALILWEVINKRYQQLGFTDIPGVFIRAGHMVSLEEVDTKCKALTISQLHPVTKKVLVVTEYLNKGDSISKFHTSFFEQSVPFDITTVKARSRRTFYLKQWCGVNRLFSGTPDEVISGEDPPKIWRSQLCSLPWRYSNKLLEEDLSIDPSLYEAGMKATEDIKILTERLMRVFSVV